MTKKLKAQNDCEVNLVSMKTINDCSMILLLMCLHLLLL